MSAPPRLVRPRFAPARALLDACRAAGLDAAPADLRLERDRTPLGDWTSAVAVRATRGDRARAHTLALRVAAHAGAHASPDGLLHLRLPDGAPPPARAWVDAPRTSWPVRARHLDDPAYAALLAHARLCRPDLPPPTRAVRVAAADALRAADRAAQQGRAHHLVDWLAATGAVVLPWTQDSGPVPDGEPAPALARALRTDLADALRAAGLTPTERL